MLQNSLLTGAGLNPDAIGCTSQTKINNPVYLFSDIIHLVGPGQSKTGYNLSGDAPVSNSQLNFTDVLGKYIQTPDYNNSSATNAQTATLTDQINNQQDASVQAQNNLSFTGLQEFLSGLFNSLSAMGFKLTQVKGLSSNSGDNQNNTTSANQNETTAYKTTLSLNADLLSLIINTHGNNDKLTEGIDKNSKSSKQDANSTQSAVDNINAIILNLLKQNKPIILNINFPGQNLKIEIAGVNKSEPATGNIDKSGNTETLSAGSNLNGTKIEKTQAGIQINLSSQDGKAITGNKNNAVDSNLTAFPADEASSNGVGKNNKASVNSTKADLLNIESGSIKNSNLKITTGESVDNPAIINAEENISMGNPTTQKIAAIEDGKNSVEINLASPKDEMLIDPGKSLINSSKPVSANANINESNGKNTPQAGNKYTVTISSGDKTLYSNNINDLESILQGFNTNNITDNKLINAQQKLLYNLNGVELKNNLDGVGNGYESDTVSAYLNNFSNIKAKLSSAVEPENSTNSKLSNKQNIYNKSADNTSALYSNTVKKEVLNQSKFINADKAVNVSDASSNSVNKLAGAIQSGDQASTGSNNHQAENNNVSGVKLNSDISPVSNIKAETTGGDLGKKSDRGNKQSDNSNINSGQLINTDRQTIIKNNNVNQNLNQFNDIYKTINARELISELSGYMAQGKSKSVMLKLKPENLGKVKIVLKVVDKVVHANLEVENESVKQAIQNNISTLKQSLNMSGLQLNSITVSLSGGENKSDKAYTQQHKKKTSSGLNSKKIITESEPVTSKNMGYNTYDYLI